MSEEEANPIADLMDEIQAESHRFIEYISSIKPGIKYEDAFAVWIFHKFALIQTQMAAQAQESVIESRLASIERQLEKVNMNLTSR